MSLPTEPYSRIERYLAKLAGQDVDIPDKPITRIECYLDYLVHNGGGVPASNAGAHNAVFRGRSLGTSLTDDQIAAIQAGTFDDIFVGDYWTINDTVYRIAGLDLYLGSGDIELNTHHVVIVPDNALYDQKMNTAQTAVGGYLNSELKQAGLDDALTQISGAFGAAHVLPHRTYLTSTTTDGTPTACTWATSSLDLMTETIVLGRGAFGTQNRNGYNIGSALTQFPLFALMPRYIRASSSYWLQDVYNSSSFTRISAYGVPIYTQASGVYGVRPYFLIA